LEIGILKTDLNKSPTGARLLPWMPEIISLWLKDEWFQ